MISDIQKFAGCFQGDLQQCSRSPSFLITSQSPNFFNPAEIRSDSGTSSQ